MNEKICIFNSSLVQEPFNCNQGYVKFILKINEVLKCAIN